MKKNLMRNLFISLLFSALLGYAVFLFLQFGTVFSALIRNIILGCIAILFVCIWWIFIADVISARRHADEDDEDDFDLEDEDSEFFDFANQNKPGAVPLSGDPVNDLVMRPAEAPAAPAPAPAAPKAEPAPEPVKAAAKPELPKVEPVKPEAAKAEPVKPVLPNIAPDKPAAPKAESEAKTPAAAPVGDDTKEVPARHLKSRLDVPVAEPAKVEAVHVAEPEPAPQPAPQPAPEKPAPKPEPPVLSTHTTPPAAPQPAPQKPEPKPEKPAPVEAATRTFPPVKPGEEATRTFPPIKAQPSTQVFDRVTPAKPQPAPAKPAPAPAKPKVDVNTLPFSQITPELISTLTEEERAVLGQRLMREKKRRETIRQQHEETQRALDARLEAARAANRPANAPSPVIMPVHPLATPVMPRTKDTAAQQPEEATFNTTQIDTNLAALRTPPSMSIDEGKLSSRQRDASARVQAEIAAREKARREAEQRREAERLAAEQKLRKANEEQLRREAERLAAEERERKERERRLQEEKLRREADLAAREKAERAAEERRKAEIRMRQEILTRDYMRRQRDEAAQRESVRAAQLEAARKELENRLRDEAMEKERSLRAMAAARDAIHALDEDIRARQEELAAIEQKLEERIALTSDLSMDPSYLTSTNYISDMHAERALRDDKERLERELAVMNKRLEAQQHQFDLLYRREEAKLKNRDARISQLNQWKTQEETGETDETGNE